MSSTLIRDYYDAFNRKDWPTFLSKLADSVRHEVNQGEVRLGIKAFQEFMDHMNRCYDEKVTNLVVFSSETNNRFAAEFTIEGKYLVTDTPLPEARGQTYKIQVGAFFEVNHGKIQRITNYYNLNEWLRQIR